MWAYFRAQQACMSHDGGAGQLKPETPNNSAGRLRGLEGCETRKMKRKETMVVDNLQRPLTAGSAQRIRLIPA
jgi:hypothetical protein